MKKHLFTIPTSKYYQNLNKCFRHYIPINKIPNILYESDKDLVIDELVNYNYFEKLETELETFEPMEDLKYPPEYDADLPYVVTFDD